MGSEPMETYVLAVSTGREEYMKELLKTYAPLRDRRIWIPMRTLHIMAEGERKLIRKPLLPGYLLVDAGDYDALRDVLKKFRVKSYSMILGKNTDTGEDVPLRTVSEKEKEWIRRLTGEAIPKAVIVDEKIHFTDGPMAGMDGYVVKYDRKKGNCLVKMEMFGRDVEIWVGVEVLDGKV